MDQIFVTVGKHGRLVIPAEVRKNLDLKEGSRLLLEVEDGQMVLSTPVQHWRQARALFQQLVPERGTIVDELIADRRAEADQEDRVTP